MLLHIDFRLVVVLVIAIASVIVLMLLLTSSTTVNLDHAISVFATLLRLAVLITAFLCLAVLILQLLHRRLMMRIVLINSVIVIPTICDLDDLTLIGDHIRLVIAFVIWMLVYYDLAVCITSDIVEAHGL